MILSDVSQALSLLYFIGASKCDDPICTILAGLQGGEINATRRDDYSIREIHKVISGSERQQNTHMETTSR